MDALDRRALLKGTLTIAAIAAAPALAFPAPITPAEYVAILEEGGIRFFAYGDNWYGLDLWGMKQTPPGGRCALFEAGRRATEHPDPGIFNEAVHAYLIETGRIA